jgi:hypothetical protein
MAKRRPDKRRSRRNEKQTPMTQAAMTLRLLQGGPEHLKENIIEAMQDSHRLQQEPEFKAFYFDLEQILPVARRQFNRYKRRLFKAIKAKDQDTFDTTYDDYRIAAVAELATPEFNEQLRQRLDRCSKRLTHSRQADLFEAATVTAVFLNSKELGEKIPLGLHGLVASIYEASFDQAMFKWPDARYQVGDDLSTMWQARAETDDLALLARVVAAATTFDELLANMAGNVEVAMALHRQEHHLIDEFQQETLAKGLWLGPDCFTRDELKLVVNIMETEHLNKPWSLSRYIGLLTVFNFINSLLEALYELMTPQRRDDAVAWWQAIGQTCFNDETLRRFAPHVLAAIHSLRTAPELSRSRAITSIYLAEVSKFATKAENVSPVFSQAFKRAEKSYFLKLAAGKLNR